MYEAVQIEFKDFVDCINTKATEIYRLFDTDDYEYEYSHRMIEEYRSKFVKLVKEYLHKNFPSKYIIMINDCVFVMSVDLAKRRNIAHWEDCIVK